MGKIKPDLLLWEILTLQSLSAFTLSRSLLEVESLLHAFVAPDRLTHSLGFGPLKSLAAHKPVKNKPKGSSAP